MSHKHGSAALLLGLCLGACAVDVGEIPADARVTCEDPDSTCPGNLQCINGLCVAGAVAAPEISEPTIDGEVGGTVVPGQRRFGPGSTVLISFTVSKDLVSSPEVLVSYFGDQRAATLRSEDGTYVYEYVLVGDEASGVASIVINVQDTEGIPATRQASNVLEIDLQPPGLGTTPNVELNAAPANLKRAEIDSVTLGTTVEVSFSMNETLQVLSGVPSLTVTAVSQTAPSSVITFSVPTPGTNPFFSVSATITDSGLTEGMYNLQIVATDEAGNATTTPLTEVDAFLLDLTAPSFLRAMPGDPANVEFVRAPWGQDTAARFFQLRQSDTGLQVVDALLDPLVDVVVFDGDDPAFRSELGRGALSMTGDLTTFALQTSDRREIYAVLVDSAGNESAPEPIRRGTWRATLAGKVTGSILDNPHSMVVANQRVPILFNPIAAETSNTELAALTTRGSGTLDVQATRPWTFRLDGQIDGTTYGAAAYMSAIGKIVVFGGIANDFPTANMWEWNGQSWRRIDLAGVLSPGARAGAAMAYDSARGVAVLFGGGASAIDLSPATWEWDGTSWRDLTPDAGVPAPAAGFLPSLAYDPVSQMTILFPITPPASPPECPPLAPSTPICLSPETWGWDGDVWTQLDDGSTVAPPPSFGARMAYDPESGNMLLFGGQQLGVGAIDTTWMWDGAAWTDVTPAPNMIPGRFGHVMVTGAAPDGSSAVVTVGGCTNAADIFACVWEGANGAALNDAWYWQSNQWNSFGIDPAERPFTYANPEADGVAAAAGAFDSSRQQLVMFGGNNQNAIEGAGDCSVDYPCADGTIPAQRNFNGTDVCLCDYVQTYGLDVSGAPRWDILAGAGDAPEGQRDIAFAYDESRQVSVFYGGSDNIESDCDDLGDSTCRTLWEWDGAQWVQAWQVNNPGTCGCPGDPEPCGEESSAASGFRYMSGGGVLVVGGNDTPGCGGPDPVTAWAWDGATWTAAGDATAMGTDVLSKRREHAVTTYRDPTGVEDTVLVFGGVLQNGPCAEANLGKTEPVPPEAGDDPMNYDITSPASESCILHDLWRFTPSDGMWERLGPPESPGTVPAGWPQPRFGARMVYDEARDKVIMYGGCYTVGSNGSCPDNNDTGDLTAQTKYDADCASGIPAACHTGESYARPYNVTQWSLDETWELTISGSTPTWTRINAPNPPPPVHAQTMIYDNLRARVLLFGGSEGDGAQTSQELYEWLGADWQLLPREGISPGPRRGHSMVYQRHTATALMVGRGAPEEVWELDMDAAIRPSAVFEVAWDAAEVRTSQNPELGVDSVQRIEILTVGAGSGTTSDVESVIDPDFEGDVVTGLRVEAWNAITSKWDELTCTTAAMDYSCVLEPASLAQQYVFGTTGRIYVQVTSEEGSGNGPDAGGLAGISVDYIDVNVEYDFSMLVP